MIDRAAEMEDGPIKEGFVHIIAAYMKLAYKNWNRDHYVSDENIMADIKMISGGKLILEEGKNLDLLGSPNFADQQPARSRKRRNTKSRGRGNYKKRKNSKH